MATIDRNQSYLLNLKRIFLTGLVALILNQGVLTAQVSDEEIRHIEEALPDKPVVQPQKPRNLLIFSLSLGYAHEAIAYADQMLARMGLKTGAFQSKISRDMSVFHADSLSAYDAICFNNTTKLLFEDENQRRALMDFVKEGGGIIGLHAATDNFYNWPEAAGLMGGWFDGHPWTARGTWQVVVNDPEHPLNAAFSEVRFAVNDEIYRIRPLNLRHNSRVILALDMTDPANRNATGVRVSDRDIPISWLRSYGQGRLFYCSLGHNRQVYWHPQILQHYLAGIQFALGDLEADTTPIPFNWSAVVEPAEVQVILQEIKSYQYGESREAQMQLQEILRVIGHDADMLRRTELQLIEFLHSEATLPAKQFICETLSSFAGDASLPVLKEMLSDEATWEMALFALERIPGERVTTILRQAFPQSRGRMRIALVNALGNRPDQDALPSLIPLMEDADETLAVAAIRAVGKIGGDKAVKTLKKTAQKKTGLLHQEAIFAWLNCAVLYEQENQPVKAIRIYRELFNPDHPYAVRFAALRGMVNNQESKSARIILNELQSTDSDNRSMALRLLPELDTDVDLTAIGRAWPGFHPTEQVQLISALTGRKDAVSLRIFYRALNHSQPALRQAAIQALGQSGSVKAVDWLAPIAATGRGEERKNAREALNRLQGDEINPYILQMMTQAPDSIKLELIRSAGQRHMTEAAPVLLELLENENPDIRLESAKALAQVGIPDQLSTVLDHLLKATNDAEQRELQKTVVALAGRIPGPNQRAAPLIERFNSTGDKQQQILLLEMMGKIGDPQTLPILKAVIGEPDAEQQLAAVRSLSEWPDALPIDDLYAIAASSGDDRQRILALRGYVRMIILHENSDWSGKSQMYARAMQLASGVHEQRQVLSGLAQVHSPEALQLVAAYLDQPGLQQEAQMAVMQIAASLDESLANEILPLVRRVQAQTSNETIHRQSQAIINQLSRLEDFLVLWEVAGPYIGEAGNLFDEAFVPEVDDPSGIAWKVLPQGLDSINYWHIDFGALMGGSNRVAYLRNRINSPADQQALLELGSDDAVKVWLNGQLVHANNTVRGVTPAEDKVAVQLKQGWNHLLVKVVNYAGGWGACLRLRQPDGSKLDGLEVALYD